MLTICEGCTTLAKLITDRVKELCENRCNENTEIRILDFAVEDVPEKITDEKNVWNIATGVYGVSTIKTPFDNESILLAIGYYGGMEDIQTVTIKTGYDIDWDDMEREIRQELIYSIAMEIPSCDRFLVKTYQEDCE